MVINPHHQFSSSLIFLPFREGEHTSSSWKVSFISWNMKNSRFSSGENVLLLETVRRNSVRYSTEINRLSLYRLLHTHDSITLFTTFWFCFFFFPQYSQASWNFSSRYASYLLHIYSFQKTSLCHFFFTTTIHLLVTFLFSMVLTDFPRCPHR